MTLPRPVAPVPGGDAVVRRSATATPAEADRSSAPAARRPAAAPAARPTAAAPAARRPAAARAARRPAVAHAAHRRSPRADRPAALVLLAALLAVLGAAVPASAATYRSPGYKGTRTAPKTTPAPAPAPVGIGAGERPQVLVDAAGTSHAVWNERRGVEADVVRYCRLKRGAKACDVQQALLPDGPGDGRQDPQFNSELGTPRIFALGDQIAVVTHRYPNPVIAPNGQTEIRNTWLFVSNDGGETFSPGVLAGTNEDTGDPTVFGPAGSPRIGLISDVQTGGPFFQELSGARYETRQADLGDDGVSTSLAPIGESVMMASGDLKSTIHLRQWTGNGEIHDPATWSETLVPGDDPRLVGGPKGLYLMSRPPAGGDRRYVIRPVAPGGIVGAAVPLPGTENASERDLFQDPSGRLHVSYLVRNEQGLEQLVKRTSGDGRTWSAESLVQQAAEGTRILATDLASAADGGGALVTQQGADPSGEGPILASVFGTRVPTGKAGLGGEPGSAPGPDVIDTCQKLSFDAVDIQAAEGCILGSTSRNLKVVEGTVRLNGLEIVPDAGVKVVFDTKAKTINTTGSVRVIARAPGIPDVVLYKGELHIDLKLEAKDLLKDDPTSPCKGKRLASLTGDVDLLGFPVKGGVQVFLTEDASCIPMNLELPKAFGGIRGAAVLRATNATGLRIDTLNFGVDRAFVGPLLIEKLRVSYTASGDRWLGTAKLGVPPQPGGLAIDGRVVFEKGRFKEGSITVTPPYPGITLGPWPAYLSRVGGEFGIDPVRIGVNASVGILQLPPSSYVLRIDGQFKVTFSDPVVFELKGQGFLHDFQIANVDALVNTDGFMKLGANLNLSLPGVSLKAGMDMFVDVPTKTYSAKVKGSGCIAGVCIAEAEAIISSKGLGVCVTTLVTYGAGYRWGDSPFDVDIDLLSCDLTPYRVDPPPGAGRAATRAGGSGAGALGTAGAAGGDGGAGSSGGSAPDGASGTGGSGDRATSRQAVQGARAFTVAQGTKVQNVRLEGVGDAQTRVALIAPDGKRIEPVTDLRAPGASVVAAYPEGGRRSYVGLKNPAAGTWQIVPLEGQPAIAEVAQARDAPPVRVSAKLGGKARKRTLAYATTIGDGLATTFVETTAAGSRRIGVAKGSKGTVRFSPAPGKAGTRRIEAIVERAGRPVLRQVVGTYRAPASARPGRVRGVTAKRRRKTLRIAWKRADGATRYAVRVDLPDGRRVLQLVRRNRLVLKGVPKAGRITVRVSGRDARGSAGRSGRAGVR